MTAARKLADEPIPYVLGPAATLSIVPRKRSGVFVGMRVHGRPGKLRAGLSGVGIGWTPDLAAEVLDDLAAWARTADLPRAPEVADAIARARQEIGGAHRTRHMKAEAVALATYTLRMLGVRGEDAPTFTVDAVLAALESRRIEVVVAGKAERHELARLAAAFPVNRLDGREQAIAAVRTLVATTQTPTDTTAADALGRGLVKAILRAVSTRDPHNLFSGATRR